MVFDRNGREFAVKIGKQLNKDHNNQLLTREAEIMNKLEHSNIIKCYDFKTYQHNTYMFLDYMKGGDLLDRINRDHCLSVNTTKTFFVQMCVAVKYLHDQGYFHRDIKPENILLKSGDELTDLKLGDFGLSKIISRESEKHTLCGTLMYMAPEIQNKAARAKYTNKVDVWSLGVVLYVMLCGKFPFKEVGCVEILNRHSEFEHVPESAKNFIRTMLTVDPNERPSIDDVLMHHWLKSEDPDDKMNGINDPDDSINHPHDSINELNQFFDAQIQEPQPK